MRKDKWIWMGHAGHFILGDRCKFHLNTYVGGFIVSTVGELWNERSVREIHAKVFDKRWFADNSHLLGDAFDFAYMKRFGYEQVGCDRLYETRVFKAKPSQIKCCPYEIIVSKQVDFEGYNAAEDAYQGHLRLCKKWSKEAHNGE
jgi:hypothetical protein